MFDEDIPALESDEERSARHSRLVLQAVLFALVLPLIMFGFGALWIWIRDGSVDLGDLLIPFLIVVAGIGAGMAYELRKRW
jgi:hypothetical protein